MTEALAPATDRRIDPDAFARRRRGRNIAMLIVLLAVCVLFYAISIVKMAKGG